MTFIIEMGAGMVKTAAKVAVPAAKTTVTAAAPTFAKETVSGATKAFVEPVKALAPTVEHAIKPAFEATKPIGELGKGIAPTITAQALEAIPSEARLSLLARGFFSKKIISESGSHAPVLTPTEMQALGKVAGIELPEAVLNNPAFAQNFSDALQNRLLTADTDTFMLQKSVLSSLKDTLKSQKEADDLEKLKKAAAKEAIRQRMLLWRKSILSDARFKGHPDEQDEALAKVHRYEQRLLLEVDLRFTFGNNVITQTIGEALANPETA